jgi:hypothetical protein
MIATEKGQQLALQALEDQKAEAVKIATLNELIQANEEFQAQKSLQTKTASAHESSFEDLAAFIGNDPQMIEYAKYAYAAGAQDAAMAAEQGAMPAPEAAAVPAGDPAAEQDEIMQAISALLQSGQIDEAGAQQLAEMAAQAAMADQNPELSDEELMMALEQAVQAGLITPEAIQQIMGGAAAPAAPMGPEAGAAEMPAEAGADAAAVPQEAPADVAKTAAAVIGSTMMLKQAAVEEGIVAEEEADITPEDVAAVLEAAVESGELTPEDAAAVEEEIVAAAIEDAEGSDWGSDGEELSQGLEGISEEELVEALAEEGVTEEELAEAIAEIAEEDEAEAEEEVLGDISEEELAEALAEEGVTEEELAEAIAEIAEEDEAEEALEEDALEGISEEELVEALAEEGVTEEELAQAIAEIAEEDEAEELALEGSDGDDIEVYDDEEIKEASIKSLISGAVRSARSAGKAALNKAKDTGKSIAGKARDTGKAIAGKARDTGKAIAGKARAAGKATKDAVQDRYTTSHLKLKKEFPFVGKKRKIDGERILRDLGYGGAIVAGADAIVD